MQTNSAMNIFIKSDFSKLIQHKDNGKYLLIKINILLAYKFQFMNKYEIMDMIDEGAYGIVWKAANKETGMLGIFLTNKVAIK